MKTETLLKTAKLIILAPVYLVTWFVWLVLIPALVVGMATALFQYLWRMI